MALPLVGYSLKRALNGLHPSKELAKVKVSKAKH